MEDGEKVGNRVEEEGRDLGKEGKNGENKEWKIEDKIEINR